MTPSQLATYREAETKAADDAYRDKLYSILEEAELIVVKSQVDSDQAVQNSQQLRETIQSALENYNYTSSWLPITALQCDRCGTTLLDTSPESIKPCVHSLLGCPGCGWSGLVYRPPMWSSEEGRLEIRLSHESYPFSNKITVELLRDSIVVSSDYVYLQKGQQ